MVHIGNDDNNYDLFTKDGRLYKAYDGECMLFPSKYNRDWSTFKVPNKLPKTWEEFCENNNIKDSEYYITSNSNINQATSSCINRTIPNRRELGNQNVLPNKETAKAMLALCQLIQLRDCYNEDWKPNWKYKYSKYCIGIESNEITFEDLYHVQRVLTFKTKELRSEFFNNFKDLIEISKPLL